MTEIEAIKSILFKDPLVSFAYLFGSRVSGKVSEMSDWDIAIYIRDELLEKNPIWQKFKIENEISVILKTDSVETIVLNSLDNPLLGFEIISKGMLILNKDEESRIVFEGRVLGRYQDWEYFMRRHMEPSVVPI